MGSLSETDRKPHAVCIPYPAQGHINPMTNFAKLLHHRGFHITFVNTEYNHRRLLKSRGAASMDGLPSFRFASIPDGLPPTDADATQDIPSLCISTRKNCLAPFTRLIHSLNDSAESGGGPPVSCIVSDGVMSFTLDAAEEFGIPEVIFWTTSACGFLGYLQYQQLGERGYFPLKDESCLKNGYMDTVLEWVPGMEGIRLKDLPSFIRTTDPDDVMVEYASGEAQRAKKANAVILNTFDDLEHQTLTALSSILPAVYAVGPLNLIVNDQLANGELKHIGSNLWKEESECIKWLETKEPNSVVYVNFGSITVVTAAQLVEFAWGLANSGKLFLWVIRPDLVVGESAVLPAEFLSETEDRGMLASWCPQEEVLRHEAVGGFLTHSGWNSNLESITAGVPMVCWPFFAEQPTNCRYSCREWGIGMEIDNDVKRDEVEKLVRELMNGEKGREMKMNALEWKRKAEMASGGKSYANLDKLIHQILAFPKIEDHI